jgi:trehalose/maltose hydrolase-like predicted phosphorylase
MLNSQWKIIYNGFSPEEEGLREAICTLANGYFGTRGSAPEAAASKIHYPGTYIAGVYNKLATHIAGRVVYNEDLVNCPNWTFITFKIGKRDWFSPSRAKLLLYRQELDMKNGILRRRLRFQTPDGKRTYVETQRIVHMGHPHLGMVKYIVVPENYSDYITFRTMLDGGVLNVGVERYRQLNSKHLNPRSIGSFSKNGIFLEMVTSQSKVHIAVAEKIKALVDGEEKKVNVKHYTRGRERIEQVFRTFVSKNESFCVEKIVAIYTSREERNPLSRAIESVKKAKEFQSLEKEHIQIWNEIWKKCDVKVEGDNFTQKILHLHIFHLIQVCSPNILDLDVGMPARGLHGEAYRGHVFWDELFVLPFFDLHMPEVSKALLLYRYRRLPSARRYAKKHGYRGAMFPWQSGSTGEEETQTMHLNPLSGEWGPDYSRYQRHVSFAVAYNCWQHYIRTGDLDFLIKYGAEIILSVAQFASSLVYYDSQDDRYHTKNVMGPDEFHEKYPDSQEPGLRDNAYTNVMIVWTLLKAKQVLDILPKNEKRRLLRKIKLDSSELAFWDEITTKMNIIISPEGIIEQFAGYFDLKEIDWEKYKLRYEKIERMDRILRAEGKSPDEYKVTKQADVLMIFYLFPLNTVREIFKRLGYSLDKNTIKKNYHYYIKRTSHGSTLSKVVHGYIAHILGLYKESWRWFQEVLESDIFDTQGGTTPEGIHMGVMGGSLELVMRGFVGLEVLEDRIKISPTLPRRLEKISFRINYRNSWLLCALNSEEISIFIKRDNKNIFSIPLEIKGRIYYLQPGRRYKITFQR